MKISLLFSILFCPFVVNAEQTIVPLDMKLGYWEVTSEMGKNDLIEQMLASLPESQRAQMRSMMENNMKKPPVVYQCVSQDSLNNMAKQLSDSIGAPQPCKFKVTTSTSKTFAGELDCAGTKTTLHTKVINSKRHESHVVSTIPEMGTVNIHTIAEWKSETCPAVL